MGRIYTPWCMDIYTGTKSQLDRSAFVLILYRPCERQDSMQCDTITPFLFCYKPSISTVNLVDLYWLFWTQNIISERRTWSCDVWSYSEVRAYKHPRYIIHRSVWQTWQNLSYKWWHTIPWRYIKQEQTSNSISCIQHPSTWIPRLIAKSIFIKMFPYVYQNATNLINTKYIQKYDQSN